MADPEDDWFDIGVQQTDNSAKGKNSNKPATKKPQSKCLSIALAFWSQSPTADISEKGGRLGDLAVLG